MYRQWRPFGRFSSRIASKLAENKRSMFPAQTRNFPSSTPKEANWIGRGGPLLHALLLTRSCVKNKDMEMCGFGGTRASLLGHGAGVYRQPCHRKTVDISKVNKKVNKRGQASLAFKCFVPEVAQVHFPQRTVFAEG